MILSDTTLHELLPMIIKNYDFNAINPASIDIRIGKFVLAENSKLKAWLTGREFDKIDLTTVQYYKLKPRRLYLVSTYESFHLPREFAMDLKLKSSRAREGYNHSMAFWIDPGWNGVLTMEIQNVRWWKKLPIYYRMPFAQVILHKLDFPANRPYGGKYNNAKEVEESK